jgi:hypothetical protein
MAARLRSPDGVPIGELFTFLSGLYFRGKLAYARAFARPPEGAGDGILVITPNLGLQCPEMPITLAGLRAAGRVDIRADNPRYRRPLAQTAQVLAGRIARDTQVVLLGSVASPKYVDVLGAIFGERLAFPVDFVGRGDMSRGGLMLRCVTAGRELTYAPLGPATPRHGPRPPKLERVVRPLAGV